MVMNHRRSMGWSYGALVLLLTAWGCKRSVQDGIFDGNDDSELQEDETCPDQPCTEGSACVAGHCQPVTDQAQHCASNGFGGDSCGSGQICTQARGVSSTPCDGHGDCDPEERGAMCNLDDAVASKDQVCLVDACTEDAHCPNSSVCAVREGAVGRCGDGRFGSPCTGAEHCISGSCFAPVGDQLGVCS